MADADTAERLDRLRMARDKIEARLDDPRTPAYSTAPLANQLRLVDKEIDRLTSATKAAEDGLPTTPDRATFLDFMKYALRHSRVLLPGRRTTPNEWGTRYAALLDSWEAAGFQVPAMPWRDKGDGAGRDTTHAARNAWIDECRAELTRCLESREVARR